MNDSFPESSTAATGRIQPFRPGGTFEAFGRTARDIGQTTPYCPKPGASSCSQSLTLSPGEPGSAACPGFLAVLLKPAPLLGFMGITASAGTASFAWLSVHRELAHKVSLCFSTPRRCWVLGVCRPYSGRSSPQAAHKPSPSAETRAITEIQRCRQLAPLRALKKM